MKNLLLSGAPGCGKSTLIATMLKENGLYPRCAGYHTARIYGSDGALRGFAHFPASCEIPVNLTTDDPVPHMFMDYSKTPPLQSGVFTDYTDKLLIPEADSKLILMDEMGGKELETPEVQEAFLNALKGPLPVIGVLKAAEHACHLAPEAYPGFRQEIEQNTDTEIYQMTVQKRQEAAEHLRQWLREVLSNE